MPTPDYTRGWKAALAEAADQFDVAGWRTQAGHLRDLDREANIAAAYAAEPAPACRVGGPPPVPGIGWGVDPGSGDIETISRIRPEPEGRYILSWSTPAGRTSIYLHSVTALYLPHAPADAPCWRRE